MPPPLGSSNARKHGLRASRIGNKYVENQIQAMRNHFLNALQTMREPTTYDDALLQSAARHEGRALLAAAWLRKEGSKLSVNERLAITATISNATDSRDKCLKLLGLDRLAEHADDPLRSIPVYESKTAATEGLASQTSAEAAPTSADAGKCDSLPTPAEIREKNSEGPSSRDAAERVGESCDSSQEAYTREDRSH